MDTTVNKKFLTGRLNSALAAGVVLFACFGVIFFLQQNRDALLRPAGLNPNTASAGQLAQLPALGPAKAAAIEAYRNTASAGGKKAFSSPQDLQNVKGIGEKTTAKIEQWLQFN